MNASRDPAKAVRVAQNKVLRRRILEQLYETWEKDPNVTVTPEDLLERLRISREDLRRNVAYLEAAGYVECMRAFGSTLFAGVAITVAGIDLVPSGIDLAGTGAYRVLDAQGNGHFAGMHLFMQNAEHWFDPPRMIERAQETGSPLAAVFPQALGMGMLEGWESIYVDGEETPSIPGTGTRP